MTREIIAKVLSNSNCVNKSIDTDRHFTFANAFTRTHKDAREFLKSGWLGYGMNVK